MSYRVLVPLVVLPLLAALAQVNFLLFHVAAEGFASVVGVLLFFVAAITLRGARDGFLFTLGAGYFWIACADLVHTLAYKGMGVFADPGADPATQYWVLTRLAEAILLLAAPAVIGRPARPWLTFLGFGVLFGVVVGVVQGGLLPAFYVEGEGLTLLKVGAEYVIIALLGLAWLRYRRRRVVLGASLYRMIALALALTALAELAFTVYVGVYDLSNIVGHLLKFLSFWLIFLAAEQILFTVPMQTLRKDASALNGLSTPVMLVERSGRILHANTAARVLLQGDATGYDLSCLGPLPRHDWGTCPVCRTVHQGGRLQDFVVEAAEGQRWFAVDVAPLPDHETAVVHMRDVTATKDLEDQVREEKRRADMALDNSGLGTWDWDIRTGAVTFSPTMMTRLGYGLDGWASQAENWRSLVHPDDLAGLESDLTAHLEGRAPVFDVVHRLRRQDGAYVWIRNIGRVVERDADGEAVRVIGTHADVTVTKELELNLQRSNYDLEQFAYAVSHDLQEPLRMISGFLGILRRRHMDDLPEEAREFVTRAVDGADRMTGMIRDLLEVSRVQTQGAPMRPVSLGNAVATAADNLSTRMEEDEARLRVADDLPLVQADDSQLVRLLQNLIANAIKYARPEVAPEITIEARAAAGLVEVSVADNGVGIPEEARDRVFQPFQRLHGREVPGSGIGLTLCRRIVDRHGGTIVATGNAAGGTTIVFTLPAATAEVPTPAEAAVS